MPESLDVIPQFLHLSSGQTVAAEPPGFAVQAAPRKSARGRERDVLLLCLGLRSRGPVTPERYGALLDLAATAFFGAPGSVTAALRQALTAVNQNLLDANLKAGSNPVQGGLMGAVLRGNDFYAVQCGPGLLLVARGLGLERFPAATGRPMGLSNSLDVHYFHTAVNESEYICLSPAAPAGWNDAALAGLGSLATLNAVTERLKETTGGEGTALVARFEPGLPASASSPARLGPGASLRGGLSSLLRARAEPPVIPAAPLAEPELSAPPAPVSAPELEPEAQPSPAPRGTDWKDLLRRSERLGASDPAPKVLVLEETPLIPFETEDDSEARPNPLAAIGERFMHGLRSMGRALSVTLAEFNHFLRKLIARALPEGTLQKEGVFAVPDNVLAGIAVAMPIIIITIIMGLYFQEGRAQEYDEAVLSAQAAATRATQATDPATQRAEWEDVQAKLAEAESIRVGDPQVIALQQQAQAALDTLDGITRLEYKPLVVGGLGAGVKVKRLAVAGAGQTTVYALDETNNRILRLAPTVNLGYAVDRNFACGGGRVGTVNVGPLLDLLTLPDPTGFGNESLVALDAAGAALYCRKDEAPSANYLVAPPDGLVRPVGIDYYGATKSLYVLDAGGNQIWQYPSAGDKFTLPPTAYFAAGQYLLNDVIDFTITEIDGTVFLLYQDGRVGICSRPASGQTATCQTDAPFTDNRLGRASGVRLEDVTAPAALASSRRMSVPSLYLLDAHTVGVYNLGLQLTLFEQYRPAAPFRDPVTAIVLDDLESIYAASGDNVYVHVTAR